ncbi:uncharacterized protein L203_105551 [Cryptococcus depauperatus CBS 7841]|uniref:GPI mannosyltransferase 2 n=1 Tax=Cryptococcus depauperatus CBS 7841 TaxID=1295531 RepID=A0A1E3ID91_9TREE|nr:hypothetical protein L203_04231 [Cryptococcus depauperatus CBS 7841]
MMRISIPSDLSPISVLSILAVCSRLAHLFILHILNRFLPLFDTSPSLVISSPPPALRWDAIHFASIASRGYEYEQQLAFQPGWLGVMRLAGKGLSFLRGGNVVDVQDVLIGGTLFANAAFVGSSIMLYKLTLFLFHPTFAFLTSLLYLLPPTVAPSAPYTEPFYSLLTFTGIYLLFAKRQNLMGTLCLAGATSVRATGMLNSLIIVVSALPLKSDVKINNLATVPSIVRMFETFVKSISLIAPFVVFQVYANMAFCSPNGKLVGTILHWCDSRLPVSYGFVQKLYWNVGPFRYWTVAQLPNIALALPILVVSAMGIRNMFRQSLPSSKPKAHTAPPPLKPIILALYTVHALNMALLLFTSHTQIALRVCLGDPVIWWNVAEMAFDWDNTMEGKGFGVTRLGKWWIGWTVLWGAAATVLWAGHYPPA